MGQQQLRLVIESAILEAFNRQHEYVTIEHLLYALLFDKSARRIILHCGADLGILKKDLKDYIESHVPKLSDKSNEEPKQTLSFRRVLERAVVHVQSSGKQSIDSSDLLIAIYGETDSHAVYFLHKQGIKRLDMLEYISHDQQKNDEDTGEKNLIDEDEPTYENDEEKTLGLYTVNLTQRAHEGGLDPLIGRENELERICQVLCRRTKNNPLLIGDSGVGKTAIVEGLAQKLVKNDIPKILQGSEIFSLDLGSLLAGTKFRGQFEKRMKSILTQLNKKEKPILMIDEIHMIVGAGSTSGSTIDMSSLLKPALQNGRLRCIGTITHEDLRRNFERDKALLRRFQKIDITEPSEQDTIQILKGLKANYEEYHNVRYDDEALSSATELSARYITERYLPDKAIDIIDEAGAKNHMRPEELRKKNLSKTDIEEVVSKIARIPEINAQKSERDKLFELDNSLKHVVFGQDDAINAVVNAVKLARAGLAHPDHPVGSFLFVGPTGVGKTEVAKQLAAAMGINFIRFDMSEYMEKHTVSRLIGAPPGYVGFDQGGLLTDAIRKTPHCVLLLDEIEKAHSDLFDILLQVMDHSILTDNNGRQADFHNVIIIMTSNAGTREISKQGIGFGQITDPSKGLRAVEKIFSPEFRNRLSEIIAFDKLTPIIVRQIVLKFIAELQKQLKARNVTIELNDAAISYLAHEGYDEIYGARPLDRLIQKTIRGPLANELLFGTLGNGGKVTVGEKNHELVFEYFPI